MVQFDCARLNERAHIATTRMLAVESAWKLVLALFLLLLLRHAVIPLLQIQTTLIKEDHQSKRTLAKIL